MWETIFAGLVIMGKMFDSLPDCFLKKVCKDEDAEIVENFLTIKNNFEKETDKERKTVFKDRLASAFWNLYIEIGKKMHKDMIREKRLFIRFGLADLKYLNADDQKLILAQKFDEVDPEDSIYYVDEWLLAVAEGKVKPSVVDEASKSVAEKKDSGLQSKYERLSGTLEGDKRNYISYSDKRKMTEGSLISLVQMIGSHTNEPMMNQPDNYTEEQLKMMDEILDNLRELKKLDKDMRSAKDSYYEKYAEFRQVEQELRSQSGNGESGGPIYSTADMKTLESELNNVIRQMVKMSVGRQGNHFPMVLSSFLPKETRDYNFKTRFAERLTEIEKLDQTIYSRTFKQNTSRILPYFILLPGYGNFGVCWEPYDKFNKATSKGKVAIPIFCRNPILSLTIGLGDFRWQVAKEMAGYHWMDPTEGLTGRYYEYVTENKVKGDIKTLFIDDYVLWLTKESEGIQKLHKDARYVFWRMIPFPEEIKEKLKYKGFYYNELYEKERIFKMQQ